MPRVISLINLKGGVGKTTLTVALGEFFSLWHGLKVLIIDTDPQTNATVALMSEKEWKRRNVKGQTLLGIFKDEVDKYQVFSPQEAIVKKVSNIGGGIDNLHLLPSSLDLIEFQEEFLYRRHDYEHVFRPSLLKERLEEVLHCYDLVLIDCPPDLGFITRNALYMSDYYLIPVIPDILSTYGIPQIINRVEKLKKKTGIGLEPLGIVVSKFRVQSNVHKSQLRLLRAQAGQGGYRRVFDTVIPENNQSAAVMDFNHSFAGLEDKYGYKRPYEEYKALAEEVLAYV
ncbi:chromosome partitioning protein [Thermosyntropha lipolytica DSM 11003]|uniref:Chromosome partitioning protein n=1 Tax=Thermosyntropha lipolytica DSM 11003 TaxID=1123382 RepID=A0A1M5Q6G2_9FIRM|nr:AAA family ATPase [Thermosyntropha lipolytica]SHH09361.1 chromosome partitioning protein [Thermosyntropha lipolytica DSM 11003]